MTLTATFYGAGSVGGSSQDPADTTGYAIPVTVTADGLAVAIEAGWIGGVSGVTSPYVYLAADNGGVPGAALALGGFRDKTGATQLNLSTTSRWMAFPLGYWITAGDYWLVGGSLAGTSAAQLRYTAGTSGDGYTVVGTAAMGNEPGTTSTTLTATDRQYSLRLVVLTEAAPPTVVEPAVTSRSFTVPTPLTVIAAIPAPDAGSQDENRMGGGGAVRHHPLSR